MKFFWQKSKSEPTPAAVPSSSATPTPYIATKGTDSGITASDNADDYTYNVVGESFQHDHLVQLVMNHKAVETGSIFTSATLKLQSDNAFDPYAVMVIVEGLQVGYIAKSHSENMTKKIKSLGTQELEVPAHLGWDTDNPQPYIGVQLMLGDLDPSS
jgi:hypothetical protein